MSTIFDIFQHTPNKKENRSPRLFILLFARMLFRRGAWEGAFREKLLPTHIFIKTINTYRPYREQELRERDFLPSYRQQPTRLSE